MTKNKIQFKNIIDELPEIEEYIKKPSRIFPHAPLPKKGELEKNLKHWAEEDGISYDEEACRHIRSRIGEILSSYENILREYKRVIRLKECMNVAVNLADEDMQKFLKDDIFGRCGINL